ncbi:MAG: hypothetical protein EOM80_03140 [Erysipelotrichia bacterium]|nr:hypothetical protein [Erysipelotrichia bacterium]
MNQLTSKPASFDKLKAVFFLGLTCNFTTFIGCCIIWITISRNEWQSGILETALVVMSFIPVFMADAINNYTLGRIRLEHEKNWDDVQISVKGREKIARYYKFYRALSVLPAYLLAAAMLATFGYPETTVYYLKIAFFFAFVLNFLRSIFFLQRFIAPRLPSYGGKRLTIKAFLTATVFSLWFIYFISLPHAAMSKTIIFSSGLLYFLLAAVLHPLPTRFSLLRPGRSASKAAFFSIEILSEEQLLSMPGAEKINGQLYQDLSDRGFTFLAHIRMPLIELPLFQSWGTALLSADGKVLAMLLDSEIKKGIHRTLLSYDNDKFVITTDFGSPQAKFPAQVHYKIIEKSKTNADMIELHTAMIDGNFENLSVKAWNCLEKLIHNILRFLESETAERKRSSTAEVSANSENK